jgi:cytochrome P450/NADPH-cytochrome P450 reductase
MAPFSMQAMEQYVPKMQDIADQLIGKWDRLNPGGVSSTCPPT